VSLLLPSVIASGAGGGYHADAVHFDGSTYLSNASLTATNTNFVAFSYWIKIANSAGDFPVAWATAPALDNNVYGQDDGGGNNWGVVAGFANTSAYVVETTAFPVVKATWVNVLGAFDTTNASGSRTGKIYINDVDTPLTIDVDSGAGFLIALSALQMVIGTDLIAGDYIIGDFSNFWLGNQNLLVAGDIPLATRRKFISATGKPVNPSGFPAGLVLMSGNAAAFGTNQGSGGAFTTTGTLTNASSSPSD